MIDAQSCPQPHYNPASILLTLEAFGGAFDKLHGRSSHVKRNQMDLNALRPIPSQTDVVHHFAEMLSGDILDAAVRKRDVQSTEDGDQICNTAQSEMSRWTRSDQEKLAMQLAAEIYSSALEELVRHGCSAGRKSEEQPDVVHAKQMYENEIISESHSEPASYLCSYMHHSDQEGSATGMHTTYHRRSTTNPTTLDDMAHLASLDYPDAPPSTPLLPEMIKSRASFTRKLKGGLANAFLPSTPPPTPKDQQSLSEGKMTDSTAEKSEFMVRLMRSLSLACSQLGEDNGSEKETRFQSEVSDYAAQLSADIIHCITEAQVRSIQNVETPIRDVQDLGEHLAEEVIMTAVAEVMRSKREDRTRRETSSYSQSTTQAWSDAILPESIPGIRPVEALKAMAGRLIANTLVQAFSERRIGSFQHATSKQLPDPMQWEEGDDQYLNTCLHMMDTHHIQSSGCSNVESNSMPPDSRAGTLEHILAERIVHNVLKCSIREASSYQLRCKQAPIHSDRLSSSVASHAVMRAFISETLSRDTQELQSVLLWVAASQTGTSALQIDLSDKSIQQQVRNSFV